MFDKDIQIRGRHATYWKALSRTPGNVSEDTNNFKVFERYIYVYMAAPIIGFINNRKGYYDPNDDNKDTAGMLAEISIKNQSKLKYIYRMIVLLDNAEQLTKEERINRAFREDSNTEAITAGMKAFNEYFLGGLEVLYETFVQSCTTEDDYINKVYEYVTEFEKEQNIASMEIDIEKLLKR